MGGHSRAGSLKRSGQALAEDAKPFDLIMFHFGQTNPFQPKYRKETSLMTNWKIRPSDQNGTRSFLGLTPGHNSSEAVPDYAW